MRVAVPSPESGPPLSSDLPGRRAPLRALGLLLATMAILAACSSTGEEAAEAHLIAYTKLPAPQPGAALGNFFELWVRDLSTGEDTRLVGMGAGFTRIVQPQWAPSGDAITFVGDGGISIDPAPALYRVGLDGAIEPIEIHEREPSIFHEWAPNGKTLAVVTTGEDESVAVTIVSPDGGAQALRSESIHFDWSADGTLYYQDLRIEEGGARGNVYEVHDGREQRISIAGIEDYDHRLRGVTSDSTVLIFDVRGGVDGVECRWVRAVSSSGESLWITPGEQAGVSPARDLVVIASSLSVISPCGDDPLLALAGTFIPGRWPPSSAVVIDTDANVVAHFQYPEGGYSLLGGRMRSFGSSGVPAWDPSGSRLLLSALGESGSSVIWLADVDSGDLEELHRSDAGLSLPGEGWVALAFGP